MVDFLIVEVFQMDSQGRNNVVSLADHRAKLAALTAAEAKLLEEERRLSPEGQAEAIEEIKADIGQIRDAISTVAEHITAQADAQAKARTAQAQAKAKAQAWAEEARLQALAKATPAPVAKPKPMPWLLQVALVAAGTYLIISLIQRIRQSKSAAEAIRYHNLIEMERATAYAAGASEAWEMANGQRVSEVQPIVEQAARAWLAQNRNDLKGERGERGEQGMRGIQGIRGERGAKGARGPRGAQGYSIRGEKGERGERGYTGAHGARGASGHAIHHHSHTHTLDARSVARIGAQLGRAAAQGRRGAKGEKGERGRDGRDGKVVVRKMPSKKVNYWG